MSLERIFRRAGDATRANSASAVALCASLVLLGCGPEPRQDPPPAAKAPDATPRKDILRTEQKQYSQKNEDLIIRDFFQDRREGVFLDVGCAWPKKNNNTYFLEEQLGWSGIAVDALPEYAQPWRKRRNSKFFNYLVTDHSGTVETFYRSELQGISAIKPMKGPAGREVKYEEIRIPTITLTKLLDDNGVSHVDFMSMDIEGAEPLALAGFDVDRFKPALVCIEVKAQDREKILAYFAGHRYERIERYFAYDRVNLYFTPKASGP